MGAKNLDRIPIAAWRGKCETVWEMQQAGWPIISHCQKCRLSMPVDLDLVIWKLGAKASLWNRHPRCRRIGCEGRIDFQVKLPGVGYYQTLDGPWPASKLPQRTEN